MYVTKHSPKGFVALMTAILISAALLIAAATGAAVTMEARRGVLNDESKERSQALAEACMSVLVRTIARDPNFEGPKLYPVGSEQCAISASLNPKGNPRLFIATGAFNHAFTYLRAEVDVDTGALVSLQEIAN